MRRRTPSEIKAYGDGYAEAYKEFCHLLKNHDVNKAMRKMKIFADAVALTVETATDEDADHKDEPQTCDTCRFELYFPEICKGCCEWDSHYEPKDEQSGKE